MNFRTKKSNTNLLMSLTILYEDNHLLVINKTPGMLVQGDKTMDTPLVDIAKEYLKKKYQKPGNVFLGVVHRLDRPTSGVLVFARTSKALTRLNEQFRSRTVQKTYWALVEGTQLLQKDRLINWLVRNTKQNKSYAHTKEVPNAKRAQLDYEVKKILNRFSLLSIDLHSGRHHQIRAQLASIGCAIKGDLKYGAKRSNSNGSIHLHARTLTFDHPTTKESLHIIAPPPSDSLWDICVDDC